MKNKKRTLLVSILLVLALMCVGCKGSTTADSQKTSETTETQAVEETETKEEANTEESSETRIFVDSAGREVEIPATIEKVAPSGPLAQIVLYTICPDKLAGIANDFSDDAKQVIDEKYFNLPKFGQFYGKNASLNMEALMEEAPDVVIDIGEAKDTVKEDMDALQEQIGIPCIFIEATLPTMKTAYEMLGDLTQEEEQGQKLAAYCQEVIDNAGEIASTIKEEDKKSVYFALGDSGLNTNAKGSIHADVIEKIGAINAADVEAVSSGAGSEVSFEQVLLWQPDYIIVDLQNLYDLITTDKMWSDLDAVKNGNVYKIPSVPYSFMSNPPSVNRVIGIEWLGNLVYPDLYDCDIVAKTQEFYQLFYHADLDTAAIEAIIK